MKDKVATTDMLTIITTTAATAIIINKPVQYAFMYCNSPSTKRQRSIRSGILRQKKSELLLHACIALCKLNPACLSLLLLPC
jgi:hypothetical protein